MVHPAGQTIWFARHGTRIDMVDPDWKKSAERPYDPHLAEQGLAEAQQLAARLAGERIDVVYASPFLRAVQTAAPVAEAVGAPLRLEPGICEWLREDWFECVPTLMPDVEPTIQWRCERIESSYRSPAELSWPEAWEDVVVRTRATMERLTRDGKNMLLVGHGASVACMFAALHEIEGEHNPPPAVPASLFKFVRRGESWQMELEACTAHLDDATVSEP